MMGRSILLGTMVAVLLGGCVSREENMVKQGYPAGYAAGFEDGCHSGKKAGGSMFDQFRKDVRRFEQDRDYAQGWSDGFRQCESEEEAAERQARQAVERQRRYEREQRYEKRRMEEDMLRGIDTRGLDKLGK